MAKRAEPGSVLIVDQDALGAQQVDGSPSAEASSPPRWASIRIALAAEASS
ncbi:hypothetical protein ACFWY5_46805 [Nonomuraea sp. NPDC059007]|uniref:hypothetical protein n=1 Tax=Nonomuraea sp. NPDC059007 TaxID=3346692 RepID=UPI003688BE86